MVFHSFLEQQHACTEAGHPTWPCCMLAEAPAAQKQVPTCLFFPPCLPYFAALLHEPCARRCVTMNQVRGIFGLGMEDYIGKIAFPAVQVRLLPHHPSGPPCCCLPSLAAAEFPRPPTPDGLVYSILSLTPSLAAAAPAKAALYFHRRQIPTRAFAALPLLLLLLLPPPRPRRPSQTPSANPVLPLLRCHRYCCCCSCSRRPGRAVLPRHVPPHPNPVLPLLRCHRYCCCCSCSRRPGRAVLPRHLPPHPNPVLPLLRCHRSCCCCCCSRRPGRAVLPRHLPPHVWRP